MLMDQGLTLMTLFDLNYFRRGPSPNAATLRLRLQHMSGGWGGGGHNHSVYNNNLEFGFGILVQVGMWGCQHINGSRTNKC